MPKTPKPQNPTSIINMRVLLDSEPVELNPEELKQVHNYQYNGGDHSYVYKYLYSPIAEFVAKLMP